MRAFGDAFDPAVVGFDVGVHGVDAEEVHAVFGGGEEGHDGLAAGEFGEVVGGVADEETFGEGLVAIEAARVGGELAVGEGEGGWGVLAVEDGEAAADDDEFFVHFRGEGPVGHGGDCGVEDGVFEFEDALAFVADDGDDRDAEFFLEKLRGDMESAALGDVHHVEGDDEGSSDFDELAEKYGEYNETYGKDTFAFAFGIGYKIMEFKTRRRR